MSIINITTRTIEDTENKHYVVIVYNGIPVTKVYDVESVNELIEKIAKELIVIQQEQEE